MRTIPSVSETTVPTLLCSAPASKFSIRSLMIELISEGLSCIVNSSTFQIRALRASGDAGSETFQLAADRAVDDEIAGADLRAADQARVDHAAQFNLAAEALRQCIADLLALCVAGFHRGA